MCVFKLYIKVKNKNTNMGNLKALIDKLNNFYNKYGDIDVVKYDQRTCYGSLEVDVNDVDVRIYDDCGETVKEVVI